MGQIPPPKREGAERVIAALIQRIQVTREDLMAFLEVGKHLDLSTMPDAPPPPPEPPPKP